MAINLPLIQAADLKPVSNIRVGIAQAGVRKANRDDLTVMLLPEGSSVAGVFTTNRFCAAPVQICQEVLATNRNNVRALVINTGNANGKIYASIYVRLKDRKDRSLSVDQMSAVLRERLALWAQQVALMTGIGAVIGVAAACGADTLRTYTKYDGDRKSVV
mgnify:CR=1 FL=1